MKYQSLTTEELHLFEKEFTEYLAINGIDASLWQKMKMEELDKAEKLIDLFSDVIFNSVLIKVEYLEYLSANSIKCFKYKSKETVLIGLDGNNIDFNNREELNKSLSNKENKLKIYSLTKAYTEAREEELFTMIKNGCNISDGETFNKLKGLIN